ncbi:putative nucleic acid binding protein [Corchorus capsularis]|uniref:Putative nucleic acid binding protein n=1 Tax=Corchorus capsularis TaxID=210143 RepID=A0A1R3HCN2_COCAP|nr:putative nucleic acid binding protein [Corchorus capsularis]
MINDHLWNYAEYPKIEAEAKVVAEELGIDYAWNDILFGDATKEDEERIQSALNSEDAIPGNGDWTGSSNSSVLTEAGEKQAERCNKPLQICTLINALQVQYPALRPLLKCYGKGGKNHRFSSIL